MIVSDFKPRINAYACRGCGAVLVTVDVDRGVTPFMVSHRQMSAILGESTNCDGAMYSSFYRTPVLEWYKPDAAQTKKLSRSMREHVENGGLDLRLPLTVREALKK